MYICLDTCFLKPDRQLSIIVMQQSKKEEKKIMINLKNKMAKRVLAFVLSGAMIVSGMTTSGTTSYAEEPESTGGGIILKK